MAWAILRPPNRPHDTRMGTHSKKRRCVCSLCPDNNAANADKVSWRVLMTREWNLGA